MKKILLAGFISSSILFGTNLIEPKYTINVSKDTLGVVRNIPVYKEPKWIAKMDLQNHKEVYFCSPKSMFEFYFHPGKWFHIGVKSEKDFKNIIVTDYQTLKPINAREAYFVYGSSVISPAGDDLVAFKDELDAKNFAKDSNGKRILKFDEVQNSLIRLLNGRI